MCNLKKTKNEKYHQILHNRISLGSNFQPQQTVLIFWYKFPKKGYPQAKTKKDTTIGF